MTIGHDDDTDATAWHEVTGHRRTEDMPPRFGAADDQPGREPSRLRLAEFTGSSS